MSKSVGQAHLANANLKAPHGNFGRQRERPAVLIRHCVHQADDLMNLAVRKVGGNAQGWVAYYIEICLASQPQCLGDAAAAGIFKIDDQIRVVARVGAQLIAEIERRHLRGFGLVIVNQAVRALVGRMKMPVHLKNAVGLAGDPVGSRGRVGKHGERFNCRWCSWPRAPGAILRGPIGPAR